MTVTIKDVAELSGYSQSTVSLALNNKKNVKDKTRKEIIEAAEKLNYKPNKIAQSLASNKSNNISVIISGPKYEYLSSPLLFEVIKGISEIMEDSDYNLVLNTTTEEKEYEFIKSKINSKDTDGIILWGTRMSEEKFIELCTGDKPVVSIGRYSKNANLYSVRVDEFKGGYLATKHLLELGHRKIIYLGALKEISSAQERLEGYKKALKEYNLEINNKFIIESDFYQKEGYEAMNKILADDSIDITAIFAASDLMGIGAMKSILERNISIPEDIALVGFDNIPNADVLLIPLSTIDTPIGELGKKAILKLFDLIKKKEDVEYNTELDVKLIRRKST